MIIKRQVEFPLLDRYKEVFVITPNTIFAYDDTIYTNNELPPDLLIHEQTHLKQQKKYGLDAWVKMFLEDDNFRLKMEIQAYKAQLASIKDREFRLRIRMESARNLSSSLYGDIISYEEAFYALK